MDIFEDIELAEAINHVMKPLPTNAPRNSTQHRKDLETYTT